MKSRALTPLAFSGLLLLTSSLARAAAPEVGATVPDLTLATLDDSQRILSEREAPTVLVFFRGVW